jgi:hypothetical protein
LSETAWKRLEIGLTTAALLTLALVLARLMGWIDYDYRDAIANMFAALVVALLIVRYLRNRANRHRG